MLVVACQFKMPFETKKQAAARRRRKKQNDSDNNENQTAGPSRPKVAKVIEQSKQEDSDSESNEDNNEAQSVVINKGSEHCAAELEVDEDQEVSEFTVCDLNDCSAEQISFGEVMNEESQFYNSDEDEEEEYQCEAEGGSCSEEENATERPKRKQKRKIPCNAVSASTLITKDEPDWKRVDGRRIVDVDHYLRALFGMFSTHLKNCDAPNFIVVEESYQALVSTVLIKCKSCEKLFSLRSEDPATKDSTKRQAVWGTLASGETHAHTEELFAHIGLPFMAFDTFMSTEHEIYDLVQPHAEQLMKDAVELEKEKAAHHDEDGTPMTTVYFDGSWPLRSFGNNFASQSGAAVIIGHETGKVLFADTRNRSCIQCYINKRDNKMTEHKCFKNYDGSPGSMESDIIVKGMDWLAKLALKAKVVVGDGDTGVFDDLQDNSSYGEKIEKASCVNHDLKNSKKRFITLAGKNENDVPRTSLRVRINQIIKGCRCAIIYCRKNGGRDVKGLAHDLKYALHHAYGDHSHCRTYFCKKQDGENLLHLIQADPELFNAALAILVDLSLNADRLRHGLTTNICENFMSQIAKMIMGKRENICGRGSYSLRVLIAVCHHNGGYGWARHLMESYTGVSASEAYLNYAARRDKKVRMTKEYKTNSQRGVMKKSVEEQSYGVHVAKPIENLNELIPVKLSAYQIEKDLLIEEPDYDQFQDYARGRILISNISDIVNTRKSESLPAKAKLIGSNSYKEKCYRKIYPIVDAAKDYMQTHSKTVFLKERIVISKINPVLCAFIYGTSSNGEEIFIAHRTNIHKMKPVPATLREAASSRGSLGFKMNNDGTMTIDKPRLIEAEAALELTGAKLCTVIFINGTDFKDGVHIEVSADGKDHFKKVVKPKLDKFILDFFIPQIIKSDLSPETNQTKANRSQTTPSETNPPVELL